MIKVLVALVVAAVVGLFLLPAPWAVALVALPAVALLRRAGPDVVQLDVMDWRMNRVGFAVLLIAATAIDLGVVLLVGPMLK